MSSVEAKSCRRIEEVVVSSDKISALPDDLLIHILLLVSTKDAVATMNLSKRWRFLWTLVPKRVYKDTNDDECESVWRFLDKALELQEAHVLETLHIQEAPPVLETLHIQLGEKFRSINGDVGKLVAKAVDRFVRKLELEFLWTGPELTSLPTSLYTCKTLVELILSNKILVDVPSSVCLPSLKMLNLVFVVYKDAYSLVRLLSSCSALARSRVSLFVCDWLRDPFSMGNMCRFHMPHIFLCCRVDDKFLTSISLVVVLFVYLKDPMSLRALNLSGITFSRLQQFTLRSSGPLWLDSLSLILNISPKLWFLIIDSVNGYLPRNLPLSWNQPGFVPNFLSFHLEFFKWKGYRGSEEEKQLMRYILANSKCLKTVRIILLSTFNTEEKEMIEKELKSMSRVSTKCQLLFE